MEPWQESQVRLARRQFCGRSLAGVASLAHLLQADGVLGSGGPTDTPSGDPGMLPAHYAPKAKRVIYLFQSGGPSQLDLWDYKPELVSRHGTELPDSIRMGQRVTGMTANQKSFPVIASKFKFQRSGTAGTWVSELLPHMQRRMDDICLIRSMWTEAINHDPAITFIQTGSQQPGRPSLGAWLAYGLGRESQDLPAFVVMISHGSSEDANQGLLDRLWGAGFLPSSYQGVKLRSSGDPVLYLSNPAGIDRSLRRKTLDGLAELNQHKAQLVSDPEIQARIAQYEMAFRMQASVPELTDLSSESAATLALYGPDVSRPGSYAANCLLARRLVERGVRCIQLYHRGWDHHGALVTNLPKQCRDVDQPQAALLQDLKQRGLLDETLVIWGGEFGRTVYGQEGLKDDYGRDHHGRCFSMWLAGGGMRAGLVHGATDDYGYNITHDPVHIHDLNATVLHCLGVDHQRLTYPFQGRDYRITDVHGKVIEGVLA